MSLHPTNEDRAYARGSAESYATIADLRAENAQLRQRVETAERFRASALELNRKDALKALEVLSGLGFVTPAEGYGYDCGWAMRDLFSAVRSERDKLAASERRVEALRKGLESLRRVMFESELQCPDCNDDGDCRVEGSCFLHGVAEHIDALLASPAIEGRTGTTGEGG